VDVAYCAQITDESIAALALHCTGLHTISLSGTKITDVLLAQLGESCADMRNVNLLGTAITDSGLARLVEGCHKLEDVNLTECDQITDVGAISLALHCPLIRTLFLYDTKVTDAGLERIGEECRFLKSVDLGGLENVSDVGLIKLAEGCPLLQRVTLYVTGVISDASVRSFAENCPRLYSLDGVGSNVTNVLIARLRQDYPNLEIR
jgi:hypothetical protein